MPKFRSQSNRSIVIDNTNAVVTLSARWHPETKALFKAIIFVETVDQEHNCYELSCIETKFPSNNPFLTRFDFPGPGLHTCRRSKAGFNIDKSWCFTLVVSREKGIKLYEEAQRSKANFTKKIKETPPSLQICYILLRKANILSDTLKEEDWIFMAGKNYKPSETCQNIWKTYLGSSIPAIDKEKEAQMTAALLDIEPYEDMTTLSLLKDAKAKYLKTQNTEEKNSTDQGQNTAWNSKYGIRMQFIQDRLGLHQYSANQENLLQILSKKLPPDFRDICPIIADYLIDYQTHTFRFFAVPENPQVISHDYDASTSSQHTMTTSP